MDDKPPSNVYFMCFSIDHNEDDAARRFVGKYGQPPERMYECGEVLFLGPVPDDARTRQVE